MGNLQVSRSRLRARARWGLWHGREIEGWGDGIRLLDEWGWTDRPEPGLTHLRGMRHIELLARTTCAYRFQLDDGLLRPQLDALGQAAGGAGSFGPATSGRGRA